MHEEKLVFTCGIVVDGTGCRRKIHELNQMRYGLAGLCNGGYVADDLKLSIYAFLGVTKSSDSYRGSRVFGRRMLGAKD